MKISTRTEYGIRVLVTLAREAGSGPLSLAGIAKAEKLPHAYLEQLVGDLRRAGIVTATRGHAGGYRLARDRRTDQPMVEAVRALEGPLLEMPCAGADNLEACDRPQDVQRARGLPARLRIAERDPRRHDAGRGGCQRGWPALPSGRSQAARGPARGDRPQSGIGQPSAAIGPAQASLGADKHPMTDALEIRGLEVSIGQKKILHGLDLTVKQGEVHALMGPNGSGKTSLAYTLMGHPDYHVDAGTITWKGESLLGASPDKPGMSPDKRARLGLFLAFQYPSSIPGVTVASFLRNIYNAVHHPKQPRPRDRAGAEVHRHPAREVPQADGGEDGAAAHRPRLRRRYVNDGFSGGEKKRLEMLQMAILNPTMAILDETDSGLDIDALRTVAEGINATLTPEMGVLMITHYQRMLNYVKPQFVHVLLDGRIVMSGGDELSHQLEANGYDWVREQVGLRSPTAGDEVA